MVRGRHTDREHAGSGSGSKVEVELAVGELMDLWGEESKPGAQKSCIAQAGLPLPLAHT